MTQTELTFWRDAVLAALSARETVGPSGFVHKTAVARADEALEAYRKHKAAADAYHRSLAASKEPTGTPHPDVLDPDPKEGP